MGVITEKKRVRLNIPEVIQDFIFAFETEDYEACQYLKDHIKEQFNSFEDALRIKFRTFLIEFLEDREIDNKLDLNGLFDEVLSYKG